MGHRNDKFAIAILDVLSKGDQQLGMTVPAIAKELGRLVGTVQPPLVALVIQRLVEARWENEAFPSDGSQPIGARGNRPRNRYYRLTPSTNEDSSVVTA